MSKPKGVVINYPRQKPMIRAFYTNFNTSLPAYAAKYGIIPAEQAVIDAHKTSIDTLEAAQTAANEAAQAATQAFDEELVAAEVDAKRVMKKIMEHADFVRSDGEAMGFLVESPQVDPDAAQPIVTGVTPLMDMIVIDWAKKGMKGVVIYGAIRSSVSDTDMQEELDPASQLKTLSINPPIPPALQWEKLDKDLRSPFEDTRKNLTLQPEIRYYKLRYLWKDDKEVGFESDIVKVVAEIY